MDLNKILSTMLETARDVSDINFTVGQPPLVESAGVLVSAVHDPSKSRLTPERTVQIAEEILSRGLR